MILLNGIVPDELYTLEQRDLKYTLIYIKKRMRVEVLEKCMDSLNESHRVILQEIVGYQAVMGYYSLSNEVEDHPGFKLIVHNMSSVLRWNKVNEDPSQGLLWKYDPSVDHKKLSRAQAIALLDAHKAESVERKRKFEELELENDGLHLENVELQIEKKKLEEEVTRLGSKVTALRALYHAAR